MRKSQSTGQVKMYLLELIGNQMMIQPQSTRSFSFSKAKKGSFCQEEGEKGSTSKHFSPPRGGK